MAECGAIRYAKPGLDRCGPVEFRVSYRTTKGVETDGHACCFLHGLAEVERHYASGGIAQCELTQAIVTTASFREDG